MQTDRTMKETWGIVKEVLDWIWITFLAIVGHVADNWHTYVANATTILAFILMFMKVKKMLFPKKEVGKKEYNEYEGD